MTTLKFEITADDDLEDVAESIICNIQNNCIVEVPDYEIKPVPKSNGVFKCKIDVGEEKEHHEFFFVDIDNFVFELIKAGIPRDAIITGMIENSDKIKIGALDDGRDQEEAEG